MKEQSNIFKSIISGYGNIFTSVFRILGLCLLCIVAGAIFVVPLWKFATSAPKIYTITIFTVILLVCLFLLVKKLISSGAKAFISLFLKILILLGGTALCVYFVLTGKRLFAIPVLILMVILYGIVNFGFKSRKNSKILTASMIFALLASTSAFSQEFNYELNEGLEAISSITIQAQFDKARKLVKAGELKNSRVVYAPANASEEEKKIAKENNKKFQTYEREIENANKAIARDDIPAEIPYYTYKVKPEDVSNGNVFNELAAKLDQRQGTLATINGFASPDSLKAGMTILLPVFQGLFIPEHPESDFELLLKKEFENEIENSKSAEKIQQSKNAPVKKIEVKGKEYNYLPGKNMSPTSKAFFESQSQKQEDKMILPLSRKVISSKFGYRTSPISGKWKLHAGIDLAAPIGTDVFACKSGKVIESGFSEIYGNYIIIRHEDRKTSTYAHLSKRLVERNVAVKTGAVIGKVGTTGASTGPHLHFEIRENGKATDPARFL